MKMILKGTFLSFKNVFKRYVRDHGRAASAKNLSLPRQVFYFSLLVMSTHSPMVDMQAHIPGVKYMSQSGQ